MKIAIKVMKSIAQEVEIELPVYYRNPLSYGTEMVGILNQDTCIKIYHSDSYSLLSQGALFSTDIETWHQRYEQITEDQFFEMYQTVHETLSITPKMIEK